MDVKPFKYQVDGQFFEGKVSFGKEQRKKPVILLVHDWSGCRDFVADKAGYFAKKGFFSFAVDLYGCSKRGSSTDATINQALMTPLIENRTLIIDRLNGALAALKKEFPQANADKVYALGFCFGGLCVLDWARSGADITGVVSIHGLLFPPDFKVDKIKAKVLVIHGHLDKLAPPEQVADFQKEMVAFNANWELHVFGKALHAFTNPEAKSPDFNPEGNPPSFGTMFDQEANDKTWAYIDAFIEQENVK